MQYHYIIIYITLIGFQSTLFSQEPHKNLDNYISLSIESSEKEMFRANFQDALEYVTAERFNRFQHFTSEHLIRLRIQSIRVESFKARLTNTAFSLEEHLRFMKDQWPVASHMSNIDSKAEYFALLSSLYRSKNLDSCTNLEQYALDLFKETGNQKRIAELRSTKLSRTLDAHFSSNNKEGAILMIPDFEREIEFSQNHSQYATSFNTRHLANIYRIYQGDLNEALRLYQESLLLREQIQFQPFICASHFSLGLTFEKLAQYDKAENSFIKSIEEADKVGFKRYQVRALKNLGDMYFRLGEFDKSKEYYHQFIEKISKEFVPERLMNNVIERLGQID